MWITGLQQTDSIQRALRALDVDEKLPDRAPPETLVQLLAVGEASGRLGEMALRAGDLAAQEAERGLKTLVTILEPALIVAFGGLVAFVAAALLQAVYSLRPGGM